MSLRDVERAMIVFKYMYGMMDVFGPFMDKLAQKELTPGRFIDRVRNRQCVV